MSAIKVNLSAKKSMGIDTLQKKIPTVDLVFANATLVSLYRLMKKPVKGFSNAICKYWVEENVTGPAFIVMHSHEKKHFTYNLIVLNQEGTRDFDLDIWAVEKVVLQDEFLMLRYHNEKGRVSTLGLWFQDISQKDSIYDAVSSLLTARLNKPISINPYHLNDVTLVNESTDIPKLLNSDKTVLLKTILLKQHDHVCLSGDVNLKSAGIETTICQNLSPLIQNLLLKPTTPATTSYTPSTKSCNWTKIKSNDQQQKLLASSQTKIILNRNKTLTSTPSQSPIGTRDIKVLEEIKGAECMSQVQQVALPRVNNLNELLTDSEIADKRRLDYLKQSKPDPIISTNITLSPRQDSFSAALKYAIGVTSAPDIVISQPTMAVAGTTALISDSIRPPSPGPYDISPRPNIGLKLLGMLKPSGCLESESVGISGASSAINLKDRSKPISEGSIAKTNLLKKSLLSNLVSDIAPLQLSATTLPQTLNNGCGISNPSSNLFPHKSVNIASSASAPTLSSSPVLSASAQYLFKINQHI